MYLLYSDTIFIDLCYIFIYVLLSVKKVRLVKVYDIYLWGGVSLSNIKEWEICIGKESLPEDSSC